MFSELLRPVLRVLFWSRWRPYAAAALLLVVLAVIARAVSGGNGGTGGSGSSRGGPARPATAARTLPASRPPSPPHTAPSSSAPVPSASPQPTLTGPPPPAALTTADAFMAAWVNHHAGWMSRLRPYTSARLAGQLSQVSPAWIPATAVTGAVSVTSQAPGTVSLTVPTNAGPVLLTVRHIGGRWLAASVMLARTGN